MCMIRDDDDCRKLVCPFPMFDFIDLTVEDLAEDEDNEIVDVSPQNDQWNYPYNLLPSSDEEEPVFRGFIDYMDNNSGDFQYTASNTILGTTNEINQNTNASNTSVNINANAVDNDIDQSIDGREFELNIPQILLSMSRISNNLYERATHD